MTSIPARRLLATSAFNARSRLRASTSAGVSGAIVIPRPLRAPFGGGGVSCAAAAALPRQLLTRAPGVRWSSTAATGSKIWTFEEVPFLFSLSSFFFSFLWFAWFKSVAWGGGVKKYEKGLSAVNLPSEFAFTPVLPQISSSRRDLTNPTQPNPTEQNQANHIPPPAQIQSLSTDPATTTTTTTTTIVDVREPGELRATGRIPGAVNIPITTAPDSFHIAADEFEDRFGFARPAKDAEVVFYCKAGVRSRAAAALARDAGWAAVGEFPGSWIEWAERGGAVER
ncbi:hypothetical protein GQX73_g10523 [Xylaria multiplex]|uniref:Sulfurtransferase n=1 Tax=Xylaria multiplex TaxID=323545 RepID=A0A7C8MQK0_9PEZI|nr:hypothetical protein GQX73_g10523 [Xylaria multiplex]